MNDHNEAIRLYVRDQLLDYIADGEGIPSEYPHRAGMILKDWAEADRDQFRTEYGDRGCTCFISPHVATASTPEIHSTKKNPTIVGFLLLRKFKMSKSDYYGIGAIMHRKNGKAYEVLPSGDVCSCDGCAFNKKSSEWCVDMQCHSFERDDSWDVIFVRRKELDSDKINPNMVTVPTDKLKEMQMENARLSAQVEKFDETLSKSITETGRDVMMELVSKLDSLDGEDFFGPSGWRDFLDMKNSGL